MLGKDKANETFIFKNLILKNSKGQKYTWCYYRQQTEL